MMRIIFSRPKKMNLASRLIMWKLGTEFSHVCVEFDLRKMEREIVIEASYGDVHMIELEHWRSKNIIVDEVYLHIDGDQRKEIMQFLLDNLQKKYGYSAIIGILMPCLKLGLDGNRTFICSELIAKILKIAYNYNVGKSLDYMTPKDIKNLVAELEADE